MATEFVLGPSTQHVEPEPPAVAPSVGKGRRSVSLHPTTPTSPGGNVHFKIDPAVDPADKIPLNVYAFFVQPLESIPTGAALTCDWFFKSGAPSHSVRGSSADPTTGEGVITVPGVKPSLQPYHVQTVLEFQL